MNPPPFFHAYALIIAALIAVDTERRLARLANPRYRAFLSTIPDHRDEPVLLERPLIPVWRLLGDVPTGELERLRAKDAMDRLSQFQRLFSSLGQSLSHGDRHGGDPTKYEKRHRRRFT